MRQTSSLDIAASAAANTIQSRAPLKKDDAFIEVDKKQAKRIRKMGREKPFATTRLKRPTARGLAYLAHKGLLPGDLDTRNLMIVTSSRKRGADGKFTQDFTPTHGV